MATGAADLAPSRKVASEACATTTPEPLKRRTFVFPRDHAPHDGFATEWWRTFGRVTDMAGNLYDVSANVSRFAIGACGVPQNDGAWAATHIVTSTYEVVDERTGRTARATHVERDGPLGASSAKGRLDIAIAGLRLRETAVQRAHETFQIGMRDSTASTFAIDERTQGAAVALGPNGVLRTGSCRACTAYAYAYPNAIARGSVSIAGEQHAVAGTMWIEHEFAQHELDGTEIGWSRFDLSLDDGRALDVRFTRQSLGGPASVSNVAGVIVSRSGNVTYLDSRNASEANVPPHTTWQSAASNVKYESAWTINGFDASEVVQDQELFSPGRSPYYLGAIDVDADSGLKGHGYVELTGFGAPASL